MGNIGGIVNVPVFVGICVHILVNIHRVILCVLMDIDAVMHIQGIPLHSVAVFYLGAHVFNVTRGTSRCKACID